MIDSRVAKLSKVAELLRSYEVKLRELRTEPVPRSAFIAVEAGVKELSVFFTPDLTDLAYEFGEFVIANSRLSTAIRHQQSLLARDGQGTPFSQQLVAAAEHAAARLAQAIRRISAGKID